MKKIEFLNIDAGYRDFRALRNLGLDNVCLSLIAIKDNDAQDVGGVLNCNIYKYMMNTDYFFSYKLNCTNFYLNKKYKNNLNDILNTQNKNSFQLNVIKKNFKKNTYY